MAQGNHLWAALAVAFESGSASSRGTWGKAIAILAAFTMLTAGFQATVTADHNSGGDEPVVINEVELNPVGDDRDNEEWVELYNDGSSDVNVDGWGLESSNTDKELDLSGTIPAGGFMVAGQTGGWLANDDEVLTLQDDNFDTVDQTPKQDDLDDDNQTWQRSPDGADDWEFRTSTKNATNGGGGGDGGGTFGTADTCEPGATSHFYDVVALETKIVYNNWGNHDPQGRLFVLEENKDELLQQVENNPGEPADLAQPFIVRAHVGDCVQFNVTNELNNETGLHVHGVESHPGQGGDIGESGDDTVAPGENRTYAVRIPDRPAMEGAHFLHSHDRFQQRHGMFGALVAEQRGTSWQAPNGSAMSSGQAAIIVDEDGNDFREFVILYHDEIGEGPEGLFREDGSQLPQVSPYGEYGPGTKGINLRSEPFMERFEHMDELAANGEIEREHDKSQGYGSYTYGDPATFIPRAYVGDPVKMRLMNAGPGQHHVHHLHGGGIRWKASPVSDDTQMDAGLTKENPINRSDSERIDVQNLGPGESYNAEIEGGAGGVQQAVGDFLIHCHIVEHYVSGMWTFWRVYNTEQDDLAELPDRSNQVPQAVNSTGLIGTELPDGTVLNESNVDEFVQDQLPTQGVPQDNDASVWDWQRKETAEGPLYLGEPESDIAFPNYPADAEDRLAPGERPELMFNPDNGRLAFPMLRPHFGERPPFAPDHGGAPYLTDTVDERHPDGLCPQDARNLEYNIAAFETEVPYSSNQVDPSGQIYANAEHKEDILSGNRPAKSLAIRANQGDCVDVTLTSQLDSSTNDDDETDSRDAAPTGSKVNMHIHLVQFDIQASDGVIVGFNFEQSVRPSQESTSSDGDANAATVTNVTSQLAADGETMLGVASTDPFLDARGEPKIGSRVGFSLTEPGLEQAHLVDVSPIAGTITVDAELTNDHVGEFAGYEYVNYRWYPDVELGMVYWHDHVDGLNTWKHGLFGSLVVEPNGSAWCDPQRNTTGVCEEDVRAGHVVDIVNEDPDKQDDKTFTYREYVSQVQENGGPDAEWASINLRNAPFQDRSGHPLSSQDNGDPATDLWQAYPGDSFKVRLLYAGQGEADTECDGFCLDTSRGVATFGITGHEFRHEQYNNGSRTIDRESFGISDQKNYHVSCAGGGTLETTGECANQSGDYLYGATEPDDLRRGSWGILRVHEAEQPCSSDGGSSFTADAKVFVNEFDQDPDRSDDWAELWNNRDTTVDLTGWELRSTADGDTITLSGTLDPGAFIVFDQSRWLDSRDESIELVDDSGILVDQTATLSDSDGTSESWQRTPDGASNWEFREDTRNATNGDGDGTSEPNCLQPLPYNGNFSDGDLGAEPDRTYDVVALNATVTYNEQASIAETRSIFALQSQQDEIEAGTLNPKPLVLRASPGETIAVNLSNELSDPVSFHVSMLTCDPADSYGIPVGTNDQSSVEVAPGDNETFECVADEEVTGWIRSYGDGTLPRSGFEDDDGGGEGDTAGRTSLYGAFVVEPENATFTNATGPRSQITLEDGDTWEEQVLLYENEDNVFHSSVMPYVEFPVGLNAINYRTEPLTERDSRLDPDEPMDLSLYNSSQFGDPETPIIEVDRGDDLVVRAIGGAGDQLTVHTLDGHWWKRDPDMAGSQEQSFATLGPGQTSDAWITDVGDRGSGDYLYGNHRLGMQHEGQWGLLRVN